MGIEQPAVAAIIARLPDPKVQLGAYGSVVFPIALLIEAPIIMLLAASTELSRDRDRYRTLVRYTRVMGVALTGVHLLLAVTPVGPWVIEAALSVPAEVADAAQPGLLLIVPWSWAIAERRTGQGLLIRQGRSRIVGVATAVRLVTSTSVLLTGLFTEAASGVEIGAAALSVGVMCEAAFVRVFAARAADALPEQSSAPPLQVRGFLAFYVPLALTPLVTLVIQPAGTAAISRMPEVVGSLAVWPVVVGLAFVVQSVGLAFNEVVVALVARPGEVGKCLSQGARNLGSAVFERPLHRAPGEGGVFGFVACDGAQHLLGVGVGRCTRAALGHQRCGGLPHASLEERIDGNLDQAGSTRGGGGKRTRALNRGREAAGHAVAGLSVAHLVLGGAQRVVEQLGRRTDGHQLHGDTAERGDRRMFGGGVGEPGVAEGFGDGGGDGAREVGPVGAAYSRGGEHFVAFDERAARAVVEPVVAADVGLAGFARELGAVLVERTLHRVVGGESLVLAGALGDRAGVVCTDDAGRAPELHLGLARLGCDRQRCIGRAAPVARRAGLFLGVVAVDEGRVAFDRHQPQLLGIGRQRGRGRGFVDAWTFGDGRRVGVGRFRIGCGLGARGRLRLGVGALGRALGCGGRGSRFRRGVTASGRQERNTGEQAQPTAQRGRVTHRGEVSRRSGGATRGKPSIRVF